MKKIFVYFSFFLTVNLLSFFIYLPIHNYAEFLLRQVIISIVMTAVLIPFNKTVVSFLKKWLPPKQKL